MLHSTNTASIAPVIGMYPCLSTLIEAGFPAIDVSLTKYEFIKEDDYKEQALKIRSFVEERGVIINQVHAPFAGREIYTNEHIPHLPRILEFAGLLGAKVAVVHPIHGDPFFVNKDKLFDENIEFYKSLAPFAKAAGIKIALENMWKRRPGSNYIDDSTYADPFELAKAYDTLNDPEAFTVCLDIGHVAICGREPADAIRILGSRIGALHVHDVDYINDSHTLPGQGKLDWEEICRTLAEIGYDGDFTLEADCFTKNYPPELLLQATRFMSEVAKYYAGRVEYYKSIL